MTRQVYPNLFVGPQVTCPGMSPGRDDGWFVHATKYPCHRQAVGYLGSDPPRDHPDYYVARRGRHLILNLIDSFTETKLPRAVFDAAVEFIHEGLRAGGPVLVHCNQGLSRSAGITLLYLHAHTKVLPGKSFEGDLDYYEEELYPLVNLGCAIRGFLRKHWEEYAGK